MIDRELREEAPTAEAPAERDLLRRYVDAWERTDIDGHPDPGERVLEDRGEAEIVLDPRRRWQQAMPDPGDRP